MWWASIRIASYVAKIRAIYFLGAKVLSSQEIMDSGPREDVLDRIVRNDDSNPNEEKMALLAQRFTKFLRKKKPFFRDIKKGNSSSKIIIAINLKLKYFKRT